MGDPFEGLFDTTDVLERVGIDLTALARRGDLEPVRCRDAEIARVVDILLRQGKNNPGLVGKAGVGKTAIVEGLAQRIAAGEVPPALKDARILQLDHVALLAGTAFRGQYEDRLRRLVSALSANPDLILFVDELHNLIGQGTALGVAMDAANMLKPALVRGDVRVVGATTGEEYDKWIRQDPALERRFQPVTIEELDAIQTWEVLVARRPRFERHHAVAIADDALKAAIVLTDRFVPERARPAGARPPDSRAPQDRSAHQARAHRGAAPRRADARLGGGAGSGRGGLQGDDGRGEPATAPCRCRGAAAPADPRGTPRGAGPTTPRGARAARDRGVGPRRGPRRGIGRGEGNRMGRLTRAAALGALAVCLGCRERAEAVQSEADLRDMVQRMMPSVAQSAQLAFKREPLVLRRSREQVRDYVIHKFDQDLPPRELSGLEAALHRFGLIPDTMRLRPTMIDLLTEQIAGYYDPDSNALYIPADIEPAQLRVVVSHELVHALQDQYVSLDSIITQQGHNDRRSAAQAILEGQATVAQISVLMPEQRAVTTRCCQNQPAGN